MINSPNRTVSAQALVVLDYETENWVHVAMSEVVRLQGMGFEVDVLRLSSFNLPETSLFGSYRQLLQLEEDFGFRLLDGAEYSTIADPQIRQRYLGMIQPALRAQALGFFKGIHSGLQFQSYLKEASQRSLRLLNWLSEYVREVECSHISIPNGRLVNHKLIELFARDADIQVTFTETVYLAPPSPTTYFCEGYPIFNEQRRHRDREAEFSALSTRGHDFFATEIDWLEGRRSPRSSSNPFAKRFREKSRLKIDVPFAAAFSSSPDEFMALDDEQWESDWTSQYESFDEVFALMPEHFVKVIRLHPHLLKKSLSQYLAEVRSARMLQKKHKNVRVILPGSGVSTYALLHKAEKVIVSQSTVGIEACYLQKEVVCTMRTPWARFLGLEICTRDNLRNGLPVFPRIVPEQVLSFFYLERNERGELLKNFGLTNDYAMRYPSRLSSFYPLLKIRLFLESKLIGLFDFVMRALWRGVS